MTGAAKTGGCEALTTGGVTEDVSGGAGGLVGTVLLVAVVISTLLVGVVEVVDDDSLVDKLVLLSVLLDVGSVLELVDEVLSVVELTLDEESDVLGVESLVDDESDVLDVESEVDDVVLELALELLDDELGGVHTALAETLYSILPSSASGGESRTRSPPVTLTEPL